MSLLQRLQTYIDCLTDLAVALERQAMNIRGTHEEDAAPGHRELSISEHAQPFARLILDRSVLHPSLRA